MKNAGERVAAAPHQHNTVIALIGDQKNAGIIAIDFHIDRRAETLAAQNRDPRIARHGEINCQQAVIAGVANDDLIEIRGHCHRVGRPQQLECLAGGVVFPHDRRAAFQIIFHHVAGAVGVITAGDDDFGAAAFHKGIGIRRRESQIDLEANITGARAALITVVGEDRFRPCVRDQVEIRIGRIDVDIHHGLDGLLADVAAVNTAEKDAKIRAGGQGGIDGEQGNLAGIGAGNAGRVQHQIAGRLDAIAVAKVIAPLAFLLLREAGARQAGNPCQENEAAPHALALRRRKA
ncbi:hypothetical protein HUU39_16735, partial [candidate division KSB1 bacterium]|nr:hypothetical protein [candidate division KSB1 bacterium]